MDFLNHTPRWADHIAGIVLWIALIIAAWRSSHAYSAQRGRAALLRRIAGIVLPMLGISLVVIGLMWWPTAYMPSGIPIIIAGVAAVAGGLCLLRAG